MSLYVNRVRYKGGSPTLGASSGIINNAIINGHEFYNQSEATPIYTQVTEVKMTNPQNAFNESANAYIDTGITVNRDYKVEVILTPYTQNGNIYVGTINNEDNWAIGYRLFNHNGNWYLDIGSWQNNRLISSFACTLGATVDIMFGNHYINDLTNNYNATHTTSSTTIPGGNYYAVLNSIGIRMFKIWDNSDNLLFDGIAVLDGNNTPCLYDSVSNTFKYVTLDNDTQNYGTVTYIE